MNFKIKPKLYLQDTALPLMIDRGIIESADQVLAHFEKLLEKLYFFDSEYSNDSIKFTSEFAEMLEDGVFSLGTPILSNLGKAGLPTASSCVIKLPQNGGTLLIEEFRKVSKETLNLGIGTGYDLSELNDPLRDLIKMNHVIHVINTELIKNKKRPVACMATLRLDHPRILEFISAKKNADFSQWHFNISTFLNTSIFDLASENKDLALIDSTNNKIRNIAAKELLLSIAENAHYCGEPGILFKDRFEFDNPLPQFPYLSTAPCAESAMSAGEMCQFSYINVASLYKNNKFDWEKFARSIELMTRFLDDIIDGTIKYGKINSHLVAGKRRIGVSICGFAELLIKQEISYNSSESINLASQLAEFLLFFSKKTSQNLAKKRGPFPLFASSRYTNKDWVDRKISNAKFIHEKNWNELNGKIVKEGIRNASTVIHPPTGASSQIIGTSSSFEPYYSLLHGKTNSYTKKHIYSVIPEVKKSIVRNFKNPDDSNKIINEIEASEGVFSDIKKLPFLAIAKQIPYQQHMLVQSAFQKFTDESSSKTVNLKNDATVIEVLDTIMLANELNLKGLSVFRDGCLEERIS